MTLITFRIIIPLFTSKNNDNILCMREKNIKDKAPQPVHSSHYVSENTPEIKGFIVKVLKNMVYAKPEVRSSDGTRKEIIGALKRPFNGKVKMWYEIYDDIVHIDKMEYITKFGKLDEVNNIEFKDFSYNSNQPEYNFFNIIETNWRDLENQKKKEKVESRLKRKAEKIAELLNNH